GLHQRRVPPDAPDVVGAFEGGGGGVAPRVPVDLPGPVERRGGAGFSVLDGAGRGHLHLGGRRGVLAQQRRDHGGVLILGGGASTVEETGRQGAALERLGELGGGPVRCLLGGAGGE